MQSENQMYSLRCDRDRRRQFCSTLLLVWLAASANAVPVNVRVQGLALGNSVQLSQGGSTQTVTLNEAIELGSASAGSPLAITVVTQPNAQICRVSDFAPTVVPSDGAPIFVRCVHTEGQTLQMPNTLPNEPLAFWQAGAGMRAVAYPGIPYESRPGVSGGIFPYEFRLVSAQFNAMPLSTSGVSLDFRRGTLRFTPAASGTYSFTVEVRDSGVVQKVLQRSFSVSVSSNHFLFVAQNGVDAPGRGDINSPFQSISYALSQSNASQVVLVRKGSYQGVFAIQDGRATQVLAYPDEVVRVDLNGGPDLLLRIANAPTARLEGLDIAGVRQYGVVSDATPPGAVLRQLRFLDGTVLNSGENPAFIHARGDAGTRHRLLVQECEFGSYPEGYASTLFDAGDSIFENNQVRLLSSTSGLHDKDNSRRNIYRENYLEYAPAFANNYGVQISAQHGSGQVHIHHNLFINSGVMLGGQLGDMVDHDVHHNTLVNRGIVFRWGVFNQASQGTRLSHNLIRSSSAPYAWASCLNTVPTAFATQLSARANRLETTSSNAMMDTECGGSVMNMTWSIWQGSYGMDTQASGSVVSASSDLIGTGPLTQLPRTDQRLSTLGHRYPLVEAGILFRNGFE